MTLESRESAEIRQFARQAILARPGTTVRACLQGTQVLPARMFRTSTLDDNFQRLRALHELIRKNSAGCT